MNTSINASPFEMAFNQVSDACIIMMFDTPVIPDSSISLDYLSLASSLRINQVNPAFLDFYCPKNLSHDVFLTSLINQSFCEFYASSDQAIDFLKALINTGSLISFSHETNPGNKAEVALEHHFTCLKDAQGRLVGIYGSLRDITKERSREQDLVERAKEMELFFKNAFVGFFFFKASEPIEWLKPGDDLSAFIEKATHALRPIRVNEAILNQFGTTEKIFSEKTFAELFVDQNEAWRVLELCYTLGQAPIEAELRPINNNYRLCVEGFYACIYDDQRRMLGIYGVQQDITPRKNSEKMLLETKKEMDLFFNQALDGFFFMDISEPVIWPMNDEHLRNEIAEKLFAQMKITQVNPAILDQYAAREEDMVGRTLIDIMPTLADKHKQSGHDRITDMLDRGWVRFGPEIAMRDGGSNFWIEGLLMRLLDDEGSVKGCFGILLDVTDRVMAEFELNKLRQELVDQLSFLQQMIDTCPSPIYYVDQEGRYLGCNNAMSRFLGVSANEIKGKTAADLSPEAAYWTSEEENRKIMDGGRLHVSEQRVVNAEKKACVMLTHRAPFFHPDGTVGGFVGVSFDITDRKSLEAALHESEERWQLAIRGANDGIWDWNRARNEAFFSPRFFEMVRMTQETIPTTIRDWFALVHPEDIKQAQAFRKLLTGRLQRGEYSLEYRILCGDGIYRWFLNRGIVMHDDNNRLSRVVCILTDMTERREYENKIRHQATHDTLTGLPNRILFFDRLEQAIAVSGRSGKTIALAFVDLDNFKGINDTYGHDAGDKYLIAVADRLRHNVRSFDTAARMGGDEFTLILANLPDEEAKASEIIQRLMMSFQEPVQLGNGSSRKITASFGISVYPRDAQDIQSLMKCADDALYRAKAAGKNVYVFWRPDNASVKDNHGTIPNQDNI